MMGSLRVSATALAVLALALFLPAQSPPSTPTAVVTDPLSSQGVFSTPPLVLQSDLVLDPTNIAQSGMACYGNTITTKTCYSAVMSGSQAILNQSANQTFEALILAATTSGAPSGRRASGSSQIGTASNSIFSLQGAVAGPTDPTVAATSNGGDFTSVFIRLSDYFAGLACGSNPGGSNCLVKASANSAVPFSFVTLPASVIFNSETLNAEQDLTNDPSASASAVLATLVVNSGQTSTPEPASLLLVSGGILFLLRGRSRRVS